MATQTWDEIGREHELPERRRVPSHEPASELRSQVAALVRRLANAARTFRLYDGRNETARQASAALAESLGSALAVAPRLQLEIRPFEILFDGEIVYLDRDCERSLAFRLYRDGVRLLVFRSGFDASQAEKMLGVLSARYSAIHHDEEDVVTLLWNARLGHLDVIAVDGCTPDVGNVDAPCSFSPAAAHPYLPEEADLPLPAMTVEARPEWIEISPGALDALRSESAPAAWVAETLRALALLFQALDDAEEQMRFSEIRHLCEETRDALLSIEALPALLGFVHLLRQLAVSRAEWDADRHRAVLALVLSCGSDRAVRGLIHSAAEAQLPPRLVEYLDLVCPDPVTAVAEALAVEESASARAVARQLLEHYGKHHGSLLQQRFQQSRGRAAADLLRSLARLEGVATPAFLARQCAHPDEEVRDEALWHLERTAFTSALGQAFVEALRRTDGRQRLRMLALVERSQDRRFVPPLLRLLESGQQVGAEAVEIAGVLGRLEGPQTLERWRRQLMPKGPFWRRRLPGSGFQQIVAVTAVAQVPGEEAAHLLRLARAVADREVRAYVERLLDERDGVPLARRPS